ncbi:Tyrosine recombinase XerC [Ferriphaselus amnicola]|uniref:Tyrosine recombinase XerC n=1 Tax=Ferriphaselus amnicola TaxID=1188319 RepID=A0A2Z6GBG4_9PROT|nr:Tyrosine recombinase XerC [Ferriphaselus amnicola]
MSLKKRGNTWYIDFVAPSGERVRCSAGTTDKTQAQELHDKLKAESWRVDKLGEKPAYTWDDAAYKFLMETTHKATHKDDKSRLRWIQPYLTGKVLRDIDREMISRIGEIKAKQSSPATANRILALIRSIIRRAALEWEWIEKVPRIRLYKEAKRRVRWLTPEQVKTLLVELPPHQQDMVLFALSTGLRQSNVVQLEWSQVDMNRRVAWIHPDQAKARKAILVPLNSVAMGVLTRQVGKHPERVFTYHGKPVAWANTKAWTGALKRAGIENFRWHDLRHTWASWLAQQGTPLNVLQELGGWESESMVRRYAHLSQPVLIEHSELAATMLNGTNMAQLEEKKVSDNSLTF